jgi:hypothetical protein
MKEKVFFQEPNNIDKNNGLSCHYTLELYNVYDNMQYISVWHLAMLKEIPYRSS